MDVSVVVLVWICLAVAALAIRCEKSESPALTVCQMLLVMLFWPPVMAIMGAGAFGIGMIVTDPDRIKLVALDAVDAQIIVSLILAGFALVFGVFLVHEYSQKCRIIWRRK